MCTWPGTDTNQVQWLLLRFISAPACCSAAATALPGPTQYDQSARGAADLYQCPPFHSVQYRCYMGCNALHLPVRTVFLLFTLALEGSLKASFRDLRILTFKQKGFTKHQGAETVFSSFTVLLCNTVLTPRVVSEVPEISCSYTVQPCTFPHQGWHTHS